MRRPWAARKKSLRWVRVCTTGRAKSKTADAVSVVQVMPKSDAFGGVMRCPFRHSAREWSKPIAKIRQTVSCGPLRGALPAPDGHPWLPCAHENRGGGREQGSTVEKYASSRSPSDMRFDLNRFESGKLEARPLGGVWGQVNGTMRDRAEVFTQPSHIYRQYVSKPAPKMPKKLSVINAV